MCRKSTGHLLPVAIELWYDDGSTNGKTTVYTPANSHKNVREHLLFTLTSIGATSKPRVGQGESSQVANEPQQGSCCASGLRLAAVGCAEQRLVTVQDVASIVWSLPTLLGSSRYPECKNHHSIACRMHETMPCVRTVRSPWLQPRPLLCAACTMSRALS